MKNLHENGPQRKGVAREVLHGLTDISKLDSAREAARRGLRVYPRAPNSDEPAFPEADVFATRDESQIKEWWREDPNRNIGIATDNLLALRVRTAAGATALGRIVRSRSQETLKTVRIALITDKNEHENYVVFSLLKGLEAQAIVGIVPGVDVMAFDDVIVGPGSAVNGTRCIFANDRPVVPAPLWLMEMCSVPLPEKSKTTNVVALKKPTPAPVAATKSKLETALAARLQFDVFPVAENTKIARIQNWPNLATRDEKQIREWWAKWPNDNIGGLTSDKAVIDVDPRNGGKATFEMLSMIEEFPPTAVNKTQGGGAHVIYQLPTGMRLKGGTNKLGPGVDLKSWGGYILLPGSTIDGREYSHVNHNPIAPAPQWLIDAGKKAKPKTDAAGERIAPDDDTARELFDNWLARSAPRAETGNIDDTTYKVAAKGYDFGCGYETVLDLMMGWNETHCEPPQDHEDLQRVCESAGRNRENAIGKLHPDASGFEAVEIAERGPRDMGLAGSQPVGSSSRWNEPTDLWIENTKPAALPSNVLPNLVERAARDRGLRLGVEPGAPAAALVTALASLVPAGNRLQMRQHDPDWTVKPIQWTAIIGPPGSNKSATISYAVSALQKIEGEWRKSFSAAERNRKISEAQRETATKAKPENPDQIFSNRPGPEKPRFRQKLFNDATTEALAVALSENPEGLLYHSDELAGWLGGMDAYRAKGGKDRPFWLQAKEGGPLTINRKTSERICVENCAISVLGGIQPDKIRALKLGMSDDGLLQRFAPIIIQRDGNGLDIPPDTVTVERLALAVAGIAESENNALFRFSPEADKELHSIEAFKTREIARPDASLTLCQWLDKMPNEFGRLSLIFHFIEWYGSDLHGLIGGNPGTVIERDTAERARRYLTEFVYSHARAFYLKELGHSEMDEHALWIAGFVLARGLPAIKTRDIYRSYPALRAPEQRSQIAATMRILEMYDWVRPIKERKGVDEEWAINPAVHDGRYAETKEFERSRRANVRDVIKQEVDARRGVGSS